MEHAAGNEQPRDTLVSPRLAAALGVWTEFGAPSFPVSHSDIRRWAIAVHWPEPPPRIHWDEAYARTTRWGGVIAPPEFNPFAWPVTRAETDWRPYAPEPGEPGQHLLNGGRRSTFFSPIRPGHVIRSRRRVLSINERTGRFGLTLYVEMERELVDQHGTVLRTDVDTIVRH
jgi:acyl dehydratase